MVVSHVSIAKAVSEKLGENEKPLSPGMKYRHYAPEAPVVLLDGSDIAVLSFLLREQHAHRCAILCYDEEYKPLSDNISDTSLLFPIGHSCDISSHAKRLFTALREADRSGPDIIYAHLPPKEGLGLALYNRMIRASAHTVLSVD
jgi:L-threonylcarbamoyladenylate synthase